MTTINSTLADFVYRIATQVPANEQTLNMLMHGFAIYHYKHMADELGLITKQAYAGLNAEVGGWCFKLATVAFRKSIES